MACLLLDFFARSIGFDQSATNEGHAEIQIYLIDGASEDFLTKSPVAVGAAAYNQYTVLVLINFKRTDLDEPEDGVH